MTSSAVSTSLAPSRISEWQPRARGLWIEPGMAKTSLPCSEASRAVMSEPLRLAASTTSQTINTSFVERNNLTCRQGNGRLSRKVLSFSKDLTWMEKHLWLSLSYYHFVLPHASLAQPLPEPQPTRGSGSLKKTLFVTPAMMAGITDHVWTMEELLSYRVPPDFRDKLQSQPIAHNLQVFHTRT